ncbi:MAG: hypothetical protein U0457_06325 [Candidatus Sericytochromatia bacterium]
MRIKIFATTQNNLSSLEDQVNAWISVNTEFVVKDIKVSFDNNNVLMTLIYDTPFGNSNTNYNANNNVQSVVKAPPQETGNFQEMLSSMTKNKVEESRPNKNPANTNVATNNIIGSMQEIHPSNLKPGRLIQNNYSKYSKGNQKISEDQAFDWD